jgi:hypothetical protein
VPYLEITKHPKTQNFGLFTENLTSGVICLTFLENAENDNNTKYPEHFTFSKRNIVERLSDYSRGLDWQSDLLDITTNNYDSLTV